MWAKFKEGRHQAEPPRNIMSGQHYCLRWNNYQSNMTSVFHQLLRTEAFVDVTLSCNDSCLKAHKVVLSACSSYFQKLLMQNPCNHPTIIMPPDVSFRDLRVIIDFVYQGEIDVDQAQLQSLLKTADQLKIKGLCEVSDTREQEQEEVQPVFARQVNLFASESIKTVTFENVLQPNSFKNPFINSEASFNQITKLKHSSSPPPVFTGSDNYLRHPLTDTKDFACGPDPPSGSYSKRPTKSKSVVSVSSVAGGGGRVSPGPVRKKSRATVRDRAVQSDAEPMSGISLPAVTMPGLGDGVRHEPQVWRWIQGNNGERVPECITVATSTEEDQKNVPMMILERPLTTMVGSMVVHNMPHPLSPHLQDAGNSNTSVHSSGEQTPPEMDIPLEAQPAAPSATLVENLDLSEQPEPEAAEIDTKESGNVEVKFETLRSVDQSGDTVDMDEHMSADRNQEESDHSMQTMMITPELLGLLPSGSGCSGEGDMDGGKGGKGWTQEDMDAALDALKNHNMSLTRASATYGIPSTTLWQRAHRMGIDTPKKEGSTKNWTEDSLNNALEALRTGTISANKASKAYGIPSSTLYKIARREGIRLAAPFNAAPTTWTQEDLDRALESIRSGQSSVQKASTEFGIPTGTLYGRCKREGIELSRSNPTPWSEDAMGEALEAVRVGQMSINQAAIHYNLPYSSLYGRFKRGKYDTDESTPGSEISQGMMLVNYPDQYSGLHTFQNQPGS